MENKAAQWRANLPRIELGEHGKPCHHPLGQSRYMGFSHSGGVAVMQCKLCGELWDKDVS